MADEKTLAAMEKFGGSFVLALAKLYRVADPVNRRLSFERYFAQYDEMAQLSERVIRT